MPRGAEPRRTGAERGAARGGAERERTERWAEGSSANEVRAERGRGWGVGAGRGKGRGGGGREGTAPKVPRANRGRAERGRAKRGRAERGQANILNKQKTAPRRSGW